jgi:hypothetical protein
MILSFLGLLFSLCRRHFYVVIDLNFFDFGEGCCPTLTIFYEFGQLEPGILSLRIFSRLINSGALQIRQRLLRTVHSRPYFLIILALEVGLIGESIPISLKGRCTYMSKLDNDVIVLFSKSLNDWFYYWKGNVICAWTDLLSLVFFLFLFGTQRY